VAGDYDGDGIRAVRRADRAKSLGRADGAGKLGIAPRLAIGDLEKRVPDLLLEGRPAEVQRQLECAPPSGEILIELGGCLADHGVGVTVPFLNASGACHFGQELEGGLDEGEAADSPFRRGEVEDQAGRRGEYRPGSHDSSLHQKRSLASANAWYNGTFPMARSDTGGMSGEKTVLLLTPRGFCAGVVRAIDVVKIALSLYGAPIYVRKEIVHNRYVVEELRAAGAICVEEIDEAPVGARVIFSAHGVSPAVRRKAVERDLKVIDATCPLVTKVHLEAIRFARDGYTIVLIGHRAHDEVAGTLGEAPESTVIVETVEDVDTLQVVDPRKVCYLTQTTLSLDETRDIVERLRERFPEIQGPPAHDICYATQNRQQAVKGAAPACDLLLVVGSRNSSNSRRLVEVCEKNGVPAYLVDDAGEVDPAWLERVNTVAVTAGASAPEHLVQELLASLRRMGFGSLKELAVKEEDVRFLLPPELAHVPANPLAVYHP
jgi:4-hydroxy-3-methylbut-2-en-1-yl diphosphate reductase